ncbi:MAG: molybdopterin molybdenumtransferase MoeA, partial [Deltaproteobacteria bacterium]|nr:molybdopterin molybdenumtransferase MoeA [Deltaproteobacteria bacterium]
MPTFEEARSIILSNVPTLGMERVDLLGSLGRVAAEDVAAPWDMPLYDNSAMDGFAVRSEDCRAG